MERLVGRAQRAVERELNALLGFRTEHFGNRHGDFGSSVAVEI
jgi:hypothetical protein